MRDIDSIVVWVYDDREYKERILHAYIPPGVRIPLICVEGSDEEPGIDLLAENTARRSRLLIFKRRYLVAEELAYVDGREGLPLQATRTHQEESR